MSMILLRAVTIDDDFLINSLEAGGSFVVGTSNFTCKIQAVKVGA